MSLLSIFYVAIAVTFFIVPLRVSHEAEAGGPDASQHDEKYMQGTLPVAAPDGLKEHQIL